MVFLLLLVVLWSTLLLLLLQHLLCSIVRGREAVELEELTGSAGPEACCHYVVTLDEECVRLLLVAVVLEVLVLAMIPVLTSGRNSTHPVHIHSIVRGYGLLDGCVCMCVWLCSGSCVECGELICGEVRADQ